jgi:hypothetical protein
MGITDVPIEKIKRWHQKFDLENLKEIEEAELPKPPIDDSIKCKTGQELLNIAKNIYSSRVSYFFIYITIINSSGFNKLKFLDSRSYKNNCRAIGRKNR